MLFHFRRTYQINRRFELEIVYFLNLDCLLDYFLDLIHSKNHSEIYLNAKECKKHNICNHIGVPELVTNVSVTQTFSLNNKEILIPEKRKL